LPLVLFPGQVLPLHIFEERYKLMITRCLDGDATFGIVLSRPGTPPCVHIGTLAHITKVQHLEEGRFNIETVGVDRFFVTEFYYDEPYLSGDITLIPAEEDHSPEGFRLAAETKNLFRHYLVALLTLHGRSKDESQSIMTKFSLSLDPLLLSNLIAVNMRIAAHIKQKLLESSSPIARLQMEITLLQYEIGIMHLSLARLPERMGIHSSYELN
jgi:Lon protease-like protein